MRKIFSGVLGVILTASVVTGAAFALFSASATVSGINFSTGNALIEVSKTEESGYTTSLDADLNITGVVPGFGEDNSQFAPIFVRNGSDFTVAVTAQLTAATGWNSNALKNYVQVAVVPEGETPADEDYKTLVQWNATPQPLVEGDNELAPDEVRQYVAFVRLPSDAPDTLEGASLTDIEFTITGTQTETEPEPTATPEPTPTATPEPTPES